MFVLVTNSRPPYCFDVGHVLGLPTGCAYRFRYRKKWIDPNQETCLVKGKPAVIVLRDFATAAFTPCRFAKISKVLPSGDFHWIEFELGEYVSASDLDQLPKFISKALIEINVRNEPSYLLAPLVFSIDYQRHENGDEDDSARWDRVVNTISRLNCYQDYSFARIVGALPVGVSLIQHKGWARRLWADRAYNLYVLQKLAREDDAEDQILEPYTVVLSSEDGRTEIVRSHQRVVGQYDLLRYSFHTSAGYFSDSTCALALGVEKKRRSGLPVFPELSFDLPVTPTWKKKIWSAIRIVSVVFALPLFAFPVAFAGSVPFDENGVRAIGMLLTIVATGSIDEVLKMFATNASKRIGQ